MTDSSWLMFRPLLRPECQPVSHNFDTTPWASGGRSAPLSLVGPTRPLTPWVGPALLLRPPVAVGVPGWQHEGQLGDSAMPGCHTDHFKSQSCPPKFFFQSEDQAFALENFLQNTKTLGRLCITEEERPRDLRGHPKHSPNMSSPNLDRDV